MALRIQLLILFYLTAFGVNAAAADTDENRPAAERAKAAIVQYIRQHSVDFAGKPNADILEKLPLILDGQESGLYRFGGIELHVKKLYWRIWLEGPYDFYDYSAKLALAPDGVFTTLKPEVLHAHKRVP